MAESHYLIDVRDLKKHFPLKQNLFQRGGESGVIKAVDGVSFRIKKGHSLGIAGESGCGKTTTGKMALRLLTPTDGQFFFEGKDVTHLKEKKERKTFRKQAQLMFQNPYEAINPRFTVGRAIMEPLIIHDVGSVSDRQQRVKQALERVNLTPVDFFAAKFPHQMSGGQLQRAVLARALVIEPSFLVADEPVSMLDVSVRAGVLNLMKEISESMKLTTIYISHDLSLIQYMCQETAIMYLGTIVEQGPTAKVLSNPQHPYTKALIAAVPVPDPDYEGDELRIHSHVPNPVALPPGCLFQNRCYQVADICKQEVPRLVEVEAGHFIACNQVDNHRN
jgi:oligopeptide/dipeptide ABC transporter ATP-binding protein